MTSIGIDVHTSGPVFDGRAERLLHEMARQVVWDVGMDALSEVHQLMDATFRNPTPYYETQVTIERRTDSVRVHDRGIIYGPWLEGTGSRNRTTRFKGYANFRRAAQHVQGRVPQIAERTVRHYVNRMGG